MKRFSQKVGVLLLPVLLLLVYPILPALAASEKDISSRTDNLSREEGDVIIRHSAASEDTMRNELKTSPPPIVSNANNPAFDFSKIDDDVLAEFKKAWRVSKAGTMEIEGVVLVFNNIDGTYSGESQGQTNQYKAFTFTWRPNAIAIVHTHPNTSDPRPHLEDVRLADRLKVPIITITTRGMYMYDPATRKTTKVLDGVEWLDFPRAYRRAAQKSNQ